MGEPEPFRYDLCPRVAGSEVRLLAAFAAHCLPWEAGAGGLAQLLGGPATLGPARLVPAGELAASLPPDVTLVTRGDGRVLGVAVAPELAVRLVARLLGDPEAELAAARALSPAERGVLRYLVARALDALGARDLRVGAVLGPAGAAAALGTSLVAGAAVPPDGWVRVVVPETVLAAPMPPRPLARYLAGPRLAAVPIRFRAALGAAQLSRAELATMEPGDVLVIDLTRASLAAGRTRISATAQVHPDGARPPELHIQEAPVKEALLDDLPVEVLAEVGRVTLSARAAVELAPGSVVVLDRALGSPVDLTVQGKTIARGELVVVDNQLGIRITQLVS